FTAAHKAHYLAPIAASRAHGARRTRTPASHFPPRSPRLPVFRFSDFVDAETPTSARRRPGARPPLAVLKNSRLSPHRLDAIPPRAPPDANPPLASPPVATTEPRNGINGDGDRVRAVSSLAFVSLPLFRLASSTVCSFFHRRHLYAAVVPFFHTGCSGLLESSLCLCFWGYALWLSLLLLW
ncbi:hypothetical protein HAX54_020353, partial [Datura stramonium]|nr:hypothetical protein [Datura stramonium]